MSTPGGAGGGIWLGPPAPDAERRVLEVVAAPGPLGAGGTFYINPERAEECIQRLRAVLLGLSETRLLMDHVNFPPPGQDEVSINMARQAATMAGRAARFIDAWSEQLAATTSALEAQLAAYHNVEEANRTSFT